MTELAQFNHISQKPATKSSRLEKTTKAPGKVTEEGVWSDRNFLLKQSELRDKLALRVQIALIFNMQLVLSLDLEPQLVRVLCFTANNLVK